MFTLSSLIHELGKEQWAIQWLGGEGGFRIRCILWHGIWTPSLTRWLLLICYDGNENLFQNENYLGANSEWAFGWAEGGSSFNLAKFNNFLLKSVGKIADTNLWITAECTNICKIVCSATHCLDNDIKKLIDVFRQRSGYEKASLHCFQKTFSFSWYCVLSWTFEARVGNKTIILS